MNNILETMAKEINTTESVKNMLHFHAIACLDLAESNLLGLPELKLEIEKMSYALKCMSDILDATTTNLHDVFCALETT